MFEPTEIIFICCLSSIIIYISIISILIYYFIKHKSAFITLFSWNNVLDDFLNQYDNKTYNNTNNTNNTNNITNKKNKTNINDHRNTLLEINKYLNSLILLIKNTNSVRENYLYDIKRHGWIVKNTLETFEQIFLHESETSKLYYKLIQTYTEMNSKNNRVIDNYSSKFIDLETLNNLDEILEICENLSKLFSKESYYILKNACDNSVFLLALYVNLRTTILNIKNDISRLINL